MDWHNNEEFAQAFMTMARAYVTLDLTFRGADVEMLQSVLNDDATVRRYFAAIVCRDSLRMLRVLWQVPDENGKLRIDPDLQKLLFHWITDEDVEFVYQIAKTENSARRGAKRNPAVDVAYDLFVSAKKQGLTDQQAWKFVWAQKSMKSSKYSKSAIRAAVKMRLRREKKAASMAPGLFSV